MVLSLAMILSVVPAMAEEPAGAAVMEDFYYATAEEENPHLAMSMPAGITEEMCKSSYWYDKGAGDADQLLADMDQIQTINTTCLGDSTMNMHDLEALNEEYDADSLRASLSSHDIPTRELYINDELIDNEAYFSRLNQAIAETGYTGTVKMQYAVCVKRAEMRDWPTEDIIGYSVTDPDDEMQSSAVLVNEPFVIRQRCEVDGQVYYWGYTTNCSGWVSGDRLAVCADKAEWTDAWKVDLKENDFLVVTQNKIVTEPSYETPYCSEVKMTLGTILKLVPEDEIPENIGERNDWYNHVVYLPTRAEDGSYVKRPCLISANCTVSKGFLPYTQKNVLDVAFSCLGDRYGWGGMLDATDCTLYSRFIYRCFGFEIPSNTAWQQLIPGRKLDISGMTDEEKYKLLKNSPSGTLMYFPGHCMVYVGTDGDKNYVISNTGSVSDSEGELNIKKVYNCILNPLTVRRSNGNTWLTNMTALVYLSDPLENKVTASNVTKSYSSKKRNVTLEAESAFGPLTYTCADSTIAVTDNGKVTIPAGFMGKAKITASVEGNLAYQAAQNTITLKVKPPKTALTKVSSTKKGRLTVKWDKVSGIEGYQIQYSTKKDFTDSVKVNVAADKASKTIKELISDKKYYVRIRTFITAGSDKIYSSYSTSQSIKIK